MNVSNNANSILRQNPALAVGNHTWQERMQGKKDKQKNTLDDALKRLTDNAIIAQEQRTDQQQEVRNMEINKDLFVSEIIDAKKSKLQEMSDDALLGAQHCMMEMARYAQLYENEMTNFRDQLAAFDQTIKEYEDMLSGKLDLSAGMTQDDVKLLLETAKNARGQFLSDGAERFGSRRQAEENNYGGFLKSIPSCQQFGIEGPEDKAAWYIDYDAADIYGEIDRVIGNIHNAGEQIGSVLDAITKELERRGYTEDKYKVYFDKLRERFLPNAEQRTKADYAASVLKYMEDALEKADEDE